MGSVSFFWETQTEFDLRIDSLDTHCRKMQFTEFFQGQNRLKSSGLSHLVNENLI